MGGGGMLVMLPLRSFVCFWRLGGQWQNALIDESRPAPIASFGSLGGHQCFAAFAPRGTESVFKDSALLYFRLTMLALSHHSRSAL